MAEAILENYYGSGISYASVPPDIWYEHIQEITGLSAEEVLAAYYTQETDIWADIGDGEGFEHVQVYTGNIGDGESGIVRVQNAAGETLCTVSAHISRAGWNNIYMGNFGSRDGRGFIMTIHIEDKVDYGGYASLRDLPLPLTTGVFRMTMRCYGNGRKIWEPIWKHAGCC